MSEQKTLEELIAEHITSLAKISFINNGDCIICLIVTYPMLSRLCGSGSTLREAFIDAAGIDENA